MPNNGNKTAGCDPVGDTGDNYFWGQAKKDGCYNVCNEGWKYFLGTSLKSYLETGKGMPYPEPQDTNTNALNLITLSEIAPHPIPLPSGERGG